MSECTNAVMGWLELVLVLEVFIELLEVVVVVVSNVEAEKCCCEVR